MLGKHNSLFDRSNYYGAIDVKMDGSALYVRPYFKILHWGLTLPLLLKLSTNRKFAALIRSMAFLCPEVVPYLHKSTIPAGTVTMSEMVFLIAGWVGRITYNNTYVKLLLQHLLFLSIPCFIN